MLNDQEQQRFMRLWTESQQAVVILPVPLSEKSMVRDYADRAREYERIYDKPERQADLRRFKELGAGWYSGADVFEVACGTGYWTEVIACSAASVFATGINQEVLALARAKPIDCSRVRFERAEAYALPILPQTFTAGFGGFWWSHIPRARIQDFLRGFHQVLSPGARVMFIDNSYVEGSSTPTRSRGRQECAEAGFGEVSVAGERIAQPPLAHHDEAGAIGERTTTRRAPDDIRAAVCLLAATRSGSERSARA